MFEKQLNRFPASYLSPWPCFPERQRADRTGAAVTSAGTLSLSSSGDIYRLAHPAHITAVKFVKKKKKKEKAKIDDLKQSDAKTGGQLILPRR